MTLQSVLLILLPIFTSLAAMLAQDKWPAWAINAIPDSIAPSVAAALVKAKKL